MTAGASSVRDRLARAAAAVRHGPRPRLTARGRGAAALVVVLAVLGWRYSPRELNAVAAPVVAVLLVGFASVWRARCRNVEVSTPDPGVPGETRRLVADIDGHGLATAALSLPEGVRASGDGDATRPETTVSLPATVEWTVELAGRGIHDLEPVQVRLHDPLGLVERTVAMPVAGELAVYPSQGRLDRPAVASGSLRGQYDPARQEFEHIREYQPGDPLKRVDWKASAKHGDIHVVEFAATGGRESVTIVGEAAEGMADVLARTVATLAESALDSDLEVGVVVPDGRVAAGRGPDHREQILRLLARTGPGPVGRPEGAGDIAVRAGDPRIRQGPRDTTVRTPRGSYALGELLADDGSAVDAGNEAEGVLDREVTA